MGRRSLLINFSNENESLLVSSVLVNSFNQSHLESNFEELKANQIFKLDLNIKLPWSLEVFKWKKTNELLNEVKRFNLMFVLLNELALKKNFIRV